MDMVLNPRIDLLMANGPWLTPYIAYERLRQLLLPYFVTIKSIHLRSDESGKVTIPLQSRLKKDVTEYLHFSYKRNPDYGNYEVEAYLSYEPTLSEEEEKTKLTPLKPKYKKVKKVNEIGDETEGFSQSVPNRVFVGQFAT